MHWRIDSHISVCPPICQRTSWLAPLWSRTRGFCPTHCRCHSSRRQLANSTAVRLASRPEPAGRSEDVCWGCGTATRRAFPSGRRWLRFAVPACWGRFPGKPQSRSRYRPGVLVIFDYENKIQKMVLLIHVTLEQTKVFLTICGLLYVAQFRGSSIRRKANRVKGLQPQVLQNGYPWFDFTLNNKRNRAKKDYYFKISDDKKYV